MRTSNEGPNFPYMNPDAYSHDPRICIWPVWHVRLRRTLSARQYIDITQRNYFYCVTHLTSISSDVTHHSHHSPQMWLVAHRRRHSSLMSLTSAVTHLLRHQRHKTTGLSNITLVSDVMQVLFYMTCLVTKDSATLPWQNMLIRQKELSWWTLAPLILPLMLTSPSLTLT